MDLVGTSGITGGDCVEVTDATDAVELSDAPPCAPTQAAVPPLCPAGQGPTNLSFFDFETPVGLPACSTSTVSIGWCDNAAASAFGQFAVSGTHSVWAYDPSEAWDITLFVDYGVLPAGLRLQFDHAFGFEDLFWNGDGGVIEKSTNGGSTWTDAGSLISGGMGYTGTVSSCCSNPLGGRSAFVGDSWGYTATQLDLSSLSGQNVRIRWRLGSDTQFDDFGWFLDDIRVYSCGAVSLIFADGFQSGGVGAWSAVTP
jgi:hypothetical protein